MRHELNNQLGGLALVMKCRERAAEAEAIPNVPPLATVTLRNGRPRPARLEILHDIQ